MIMYRILKPRNNKPRKWRWVRVDCMPWMDIITSQHVPRNSGYILGRNTFVVNPADLRTFPDKYVYLRRKNKLHLRQIGAEAVR